MSERGYSNEFTVSGFNQFMVRTFGWMAAGLAVTAVIAYLTLASGLYTYIFSSTIGVLLLFGLELLICYRMRSSLSNMDVTSVAILYFGYCTTTGLLFSTLALVYNLKTMFLAFAYTAVMFACLAAIGKTTEKDLSSWGPMLAAGLVTCIIASVVNIFLKNSFLDNFLCYALIVLFMAFTLMDIQNLKKYYMMYSGNSAGLSAIGIYGAFQLYLDFINIFIRVLQLFSRRGNRR